MEQASALTASSTTPQPSALVSPSLPETAETISETTLPPASITEQPNSPTETIRPTVPSSSIPPDATNSPAQSTNITPAPLADLAERANAVVEKAKQHGLYAGNIEEEVGQVIGTLSSWGGSFWGGVKKQSASAFTTLKTDLDKTVSQAQADLKRLQTTSVEVVRKDPEQFRQEQAAEKAKAAESMANNVVSEGEKGKGKAREIVDLSEEPDEPSTSTSSTSASTAPALPGLPPAASAFLDRLTSSTTALQASLQSTLNNAKSNPALNVNPSVLRDQLAENLRLSSAKENIQLSLKQAEKLAEEYVKKGDQWLHDAEKWVGEVVKVVPPESSEGGEQTAHIWDGTDFYSFSTNAKSPVLSSGNNGTSQSGSNVLFDFRSSRIEGTSGGLMSRNMAGSRKEALLRRLREDKDLLLVDPEGEGETAERKEEFAKWIKESWGAEGKLGRETEEGNVGGIRMALVPEHLTDEQFWQRYLFHKHMIEAEDEKRKKLLEATQQTQHDDFSWDDEEDPSSVSISTPPTPSNNPNPNATAKMGQSTSTLHAPSPAVPEVKPLINPQPESAKKTPTPLVTVPATTSTATAESGAPATVTPASAPKEKETSTNTSPRDSEESYDLISDQSGRKTVDKQSEDDDSDWE